MTDTVVPIGSARKLIEHRAFVAGVEAAAAAAERQLVLADPQVARAGRAFAQWLRRHAHQLAEEAR